MSGTGWKDLIAQGWRPPYVAHVVVEHDVPDPETRALQTSEGFGTGVLIDPWHVLTCLHVLLGPFCSSFRGSISEELPSYLDLGALPRVKVQLLDGRSDYIGCDPVAEHRNNDLILLKLRRPIYGPRAPLGRVTPREGEVELIGCGFLLEGRTPLFTTHRQRHRLDVNTSAAADPFHIPSQFGAQGGFSGGPVFVNEEGGLPVFVGVTRLGGDGAASGMIVGAAPVLRFLRAQAPEFEDSPDLRLDREADRQQFIRGYHPSLQPPSVDGLTLPELQLLPVQADRPAVYVGREPLSAAVTAADAGKPVRENIDTMPGHVGDKAQVRNLIDRLRQRTQWPLRLATPQEWTTRHAQPGVGRPRVRIGEPPRLEDFTTAAGDPCVGPPDVREWLDDGNGPELYSVSEPGRPPKPLRARAESEPERCVVRLAMTAGWGKHE